VIDFDSRKIEDGEVIHIKVMAMLHVLNLRIFAIKLMSPMSFLEVDGSCCSFVLFLTVSLVSRQSEQSIMVGLSISYAL